MAPVYSGSSTRFKINRSLNLLQQLNKTSHNVSCSLDSTEPTETERKWEDEGYKKAKISELDTSKYYKNGEEFTHYLDFTLVNFLDSGWNLSTIDKTLQQVSQIFGKQCGIHIRSAKVIQSQSPLGTSNLRKHDQDMELSKSAPTKNRPLFYFIKSYTNGDTAYSLRPKEAKKLDQTYYSAFITNQVNTKDYKKTRRKNYSPTAHELAHLLCRCDHSTKDEFSIMADDPTYRNNKISEKFCKKMKGESQKSSFEKSPFLKKYDKPLEIKKNDV